MFWCVSTQQVDEGATATCRHFFLNTDEKLSLLCGAQKHAEYTK